MSISMLSQLVVRVPKCEPLNRMKGFEHLHPLESYESTIHPIRNNVADDDDDDEDDRSIQSTLLHYWVFEYLILLFFFLTFSIGYWQQHIENKHFHCFVDWNQRYVTIHRPHTLIINWQNQITPLLFYYRKCYDNDWLNDALFHHHTQHSIVR